MVATLKSGMSVEARFKSSKRFFPARGESYLFILPLFLFLMIDTYFLKQWLGATPITPSAFPMTGVMEKVNQLTKSNAIIFEYPTPRKTLLK